MLSSDVAKAIGGTFLGNKDVNLQGVSALDDPQPSCLCFLLKKTLSKDSISHLLEQGKGICLVTSSPLPDLDIAQIQVDRPRLALSKALPLFYPNYTGLTLNKPSMNTSGFIQGDDVQIGSDCTIFPTVVIGSHCRIGDNCILYPGTVLYDHVSLGNNVIIHAQSVIGSDGFGYQMEDDKWHKVIHIGSVVIEDDVEIGANCTIDRGCLGKTVIGKGTKIDNLVHIAHNTSLGESCAIAAQSGTSGGATLGHHVSMGGQSGVLGVEVQDHVIISGKSAVVKSVSKNQQVTGFPAIENKLFLKRNAILNKLTKDYNLFRRK